MNITLSQAETVVQAAKSEAAKQKAKMNIAVVDAGSNLVAFVREDGAWIGSIDVAIKKARTAAWFQMDTEELTPLVQPGKSLYQIEHSNGGLVTFPGGVVIKDRSGNPIGAVGVSGSTVDVDAKVAEAGRKAIDAS